MADELLNFLHDDVHIFLLFRKNEPTERTEFSLGEQSLCGMCFYAYRRLFNLHVSLMCL